MKIQLSKVVVFATLSSSVVDAITTGGDPNDPKFLADLADAPFFVSLYNRGDCAGTIVGNHHVLTAAHCVLEAKRPPKTILFDGTTVQPWGAFTNPDCVFSVEKDGPNGCDVAILAYEEDLVEKLGCAAASGGPLTLPVYSGSDEVGKTITIYGYGLSGDAAEFTAGVSGSASGGGSGSGSGIQDNSNNDDFDDDGDYDDDNNNNNDDDDDSWFGWMPWWGNDDDCDDDNGFNDKDDDNGYDDDDDDWFGWMPWNNDDDYDDDDNTGYNGRNLQKRCSRATEDGKFRRAQNIVTDTSDGVVRYRMDLDGLDLEGMAQDGDSGGAATITVDGTTYLVGANSGTFESNSCDYGSVDEYVRLSEHYQFITKTLDKDPSICPRKKWKTPSSTGYSANCFRLRRH